MPRCCYREDGRQCVRNGQGNPPLCRPHLLVLQDEHDRARNPGTPIASVLGDLFAGRRVSPDDLVGAFFGLAGAAFAGQRVPGAGPPPGHGGNGHGGGARPSGWTPFPWGNAAPRMPPQPPPEEMARQRALLMARQELGFQPREPLVVDMVERRRKELARKHHPDLGGSVDRMASINQAADLLVAHLASGIG